MIVVPPPPLDFSLFDVPIGAMVLSRREAPRIGYREGALLRRNHDLWSLRPSVSGWTWRPADTPCRGLSTRT